MTTQLPAPNGTRVDIHEHRQIDKVALEAHIGDVGDPHRIGLGDGEFSDQIGITRIGMVTVGRAAAPLRRMACQSQVMHEATHPLAVQAGAFAAQLRAHPSVAIGRPLPRDALDARPQLPPPAVGTACWRA